MTLTAAKSWELININCIDYWQNSCGYKLKSEAADCEEYLGAISPRAPISILSVFIFHVGAATNNWNNNTHFLTTAGHLGSQIHISCEAQIQKYGNATPREDRMKSNIQMQLRRM